MSQANKTVIFASLCVVFLVAIAGCDQGNHAPPPARMLPAPGGRSAPRAAQPRAEIRAASDDKTGETQLPANVDIESLEILRAMRDAWQFGGRNAAADSTKLTSTRSP